MESRSWEAERGKGAGVSTVDKKLLDRMKTPLLHIVYMSNDLTISDTATWGCSLCHFGKANFVPGVIYK